MDFKAIGNELTIVTGVYHVISAIGIFGIPVFNHQDNDDGRDCCKRSEICVADRGIYTPNAGSVNAMIKY